MGEILELKQTEFTLLHWDLAVEAWRWLAAARLPVSMLDESEFLIALDDQACPCGILEYRPWGETDDIWIQVLYVKPCARGKGVGSSLIRHVRALFRGKKVGLGTSVMNEAMIKTALRAGLDPLDKPVIQYFSA